MPVFRDFQYRKNVYRGGSLPITVHSTDLVVFEAFSLGDGSSLICTELLDSAPTREILGGVIPRDDGVFVNADFWREKVIEVRGFLKASTSAGLETLMDTVRKSLRAREGNLDITRNGVAKRYVATLANPESLFADRRGYHVTFCPFTAKFLCRTPFGKDRAYTTDSFSISLSPTTRVVVNTGTITAKPVIVVIFSAVSSGTVLNIQNTDTDEEIEYSGSFVAGDWIEFDSELMVAKKNGEEVDFTGSFPGMDVGSNSFVFTVTASSFSAYATIKYKPSWL